jgi:gamma-glutamyltranspeptidase/glutathione hydrolase
VRTWSQWPVSSSSCASSKGATSPRWGTTPRIHPLLIETAKLAFADREEYYGDPDFGDVPLERLLSREYAEARRKLIDPERASMELRPGDAPPYVPKERTGGIPIHRGDTTHLDTADRWGNLMSATPSGGWFRSSPVIEGLGSAGGRACRCSRSIPAAPTRCGRARPRTTLTPSLALRGGRPFMAFGTPGATSRTSGRSILPDCVDFG